MITTSNRFGERQGPRFPGVSLDLVGVAEVAAMLGLTTQRIDQLARRDPDFPAPVAELAAGRIWSRADIVTWARNAGRLDGDE